MATTTMRLSCPRSRSDLLLAGARRPFRLRRRKVARAHDWANPWRPTTHSDVSKDMSPVWRDRRRLNTTTVTTGQGRSLCRDHARVARGHGLRASCPARRRKIQLRSRSGPLATPTRLRQHRSLSCPVADRPSRRGLCSRPAIHALRPFSGLEPLEGARSGPDYRDPRPAGSSGPAGDVRADEAGQ